MSASETDNYSVLKMYTIYQHRSSSVRSTHSPRDTTLMLALGHPRFKQRRDKVVQSRSFSSLARELTHKFPSDTKA